VLASWLAQFRAMGAKPLASFTVPGAGAGNQPPVGWRVIEPLEVHQLVNHHVILHPGRHGDEAPVEAHVPVAPTGSPSRPLITNADARHGQTVQISQLAQPLREVRVCLRPEPLSIVDGKATARQHRALPKNPVDMTLRKRVRRSTRPAAGNGYTHAAVEFDAQQVSSRPAMADEIDRCDRADRGWCGRIERSRRPRSRVPERKPQLHDDRIPDSQIGLDTPPASSVISITLVRGT
jgi:hypothetical protein